MAICLGSNLVFSPFMVAADNDVPHGLETRVPWTTSRIEGTPEPPPKYTVQRAFPKLKFDQPVFIAQEPGTDRFLVAELGGKIYAFTSETPDDASRELFLDTKRQIYAFSFHPRYAVLRIPKTRETRKTGAVGCPGFGQTWIILASLRLIPKKLLSNGWLAGTTAAKPLSGRMVICMSAPVTPHPDLIRKQPDRESMISTRS